jgi:hypothetical protein
MKKEDLTATNVTPKKKFTTEVYNIVLDTIINSMTTRFVNNNSLYFDLSLLSLNNFPLNYVPENAFLTLAKKLKPFLKCDDGENLKEIRNQLSDELLNFSKLWKYLKNSLEDEYHVHSLSNDMNDEDENQEEEDFENQLKPCNSIEYKYICKNLLLQITS